jgi:uncharacterized protein
MTSWLNQLRPNEYVPSIYDIHLDKLWQTGHRLILSDLDNTLVAWNYPEVSQELATWFRTAKAHGFEICIISNNKGPRVKLFAQRAGLDYIAAANKPKPDAFLQALKRFSRQASQTVMIGDQLFTDIQGGNRCGLHTILVLPIHPREWWGTRVVRIPERFAMRMLERGGLKRPDTRSMSYPERDNEPNHEGR